MCGCNCRYEKRFCHPDLAGDCSLPAGGPYPADATCVLEMMDEEEGEQGRGEMNETHNEDALRPDRKAA